MKTLYEAANALEAHMLVHLLKQEGFSAQLQGEHLQGGVGELQAGPLVRLLIDDEQHEAARAFVQRWEATQVSNPSNTGSPARARSRAIWIFLAGLAVGALATWAWVGAPVSTAGIDHNGDGVQDETWTYAPRGTPLRMEADRNLDKKTDYVVLYDNRGLAQTAESDDDFNGTFETRMRFEANNLHTQEIDTDGDRYPDLLTYFAGGVLMKSYFKNPKTGLPQRVEHYKLGKLVYAEIDSDVDGKLDTRVEYSALGEPGLRSSMSR
jgi:hypothetical protein